MRLWTEFMAGGRRTGADDQIPIIGGGRGPGKTRDAR